MRRTHIIVQTKNCLLLLLSLLVLTCWSAASNYNTNSSCCKL